MYASLHNHTYASNIRFPDSINRPEKMVERALALGISGMAFTDHEALSAAVSILKIRDKVLKENPNFKFIFGNEIYLIDEKDLKNTDTFYHFILLAKDSTGWEQLRRLSSNAWERSYTFKGYQRPNTTYSDLEEIIGKNPGHVIASTACLGGELPKRILNNDEDGAVNFINKCVSIFKKDNFYFEMQPSDNEDQIFVNQKLIELGKKYGIKRIITTDSHYIEKEDSGIHSAVLNSNKKKNGDDRETEKFYRFTYIMSEEEITDILSNGNISREEIELALKNTLEISDRIENYDFRHTTIVPRIKIPPFMLSKELYHYGDRYPMIKKYYESNEEQDVYLMFQIEQGIKQKHIIIDAEKLERINTELDVLYCIGQSINQSLSSYLNLTANIVNIAWRVSLVGVGRGSACGFYINYLIGITQADPLVYNLPYWRFLNKERAELPDVDEDFQPEKVSDIIALLWEEYGYNNVLNCASFKTESLKSAILTSCRGLGYNNDDAQALAALVPSHRGALYTLDECLNGNEEKGYEPVKDFEAKLRAFPRLFEAVSMIEGLPTNSSIHASALYIFNNGYIEHNSLMRSASQTRITAFNMHDSDDMGALKMDVLRTDAQSKIAKCMDLLLKDHQIEWKGSLRATYDAYLHPDVLVYDNAEMWARAASGTIANLFQFETPVGSVCIKKAKPTNVLQLAEINSIMRLQSEGKEQPIDRYVKFRENIDLWYLEMIEDGLTEEEIKILEGYLLESFGISGSQEKLMLLVMDKNISGFSLGEANGFRKAIAKKIPAKIQENKEKYFSYGEKLGTNKPFLDYVWKYCIEPQIGYAFSLNHTLPYSLIAVQEMNLATRWNPLYWQCACLSVNAGNYVDEIDGDEDEESEPTEAEEEAKEENESDEGPAKAKKAAPKYGKIAKAISDAQLQGVNIALPYINKAQLDFIPDVENNRILYSLNAINVVGDELAQKIIDNRPYSSIEEFLEKINPTTVQMLGLIKAGCFDELTGESRQKMVKDYLRKIAMQKTPVVTKITGVQLKKAIKLGMDLSNYDIPVRAIKYKNYIDANQLDKQNKRYVLNEPATLKFFNSFFRDSLNLLKNEYQSMPEGAIAVKQSAFKKAYDSLIEPLMTYMNSQAGINEYMELLYKDYIDQTYEKYCSGSISTWEMDTMSFYHSKHELSSVDKSKYNIKNFNTLPETGSSTNVAIAGTVIDSNNSKHIVTLLTEYGVVDVKFYSDLYGRFNKKVSTISSLTGKKQVIDDSWFKRGTKLIIHGYRRENMFTCRQDKSSGYVRSVGYIETVNYDGTISVRYGKKKIA